MRGSVGFVNNNNNGFNDNNMNNNGASFGIDKQQMFVRTTLYSE